MSDPLPLDSPRSGHKAGLRFHKPARPPSAQVPSASVHTVTRSPRANRPSVPAPSAGRPQEALQPPRSSTVKYLATSPPPPEAGHTSTDAVSCRPSVPQHVGTPGTHRTQTQRCQIKNDVHSSCSPVPTLEMLFALCGEVWGDLRTFLEMEDKARIRERKTC